MSYRWFLLVVATTGACTHDATAPVTPNALGLAEVPSAIANAGCSIGRDISNNRSTVLVINRADLPFQLPSPRKVPAGVGRKASFRIARFAVTIDGQPLFIACIVARKGSFAIEAAESIGRVRPEAWRAVAIRLGAEGHESDEPVVFSLGTRLREKALPTARRVQSAASAAVRSNYTCPSCPSVYTLGRITVTASNNYTLIDHAVTNALLGALQSAYGEPPIITDYYIDQQWHSDCQEFQQDYRDWQTTTAQMAAEGNEVASELEALADELSQQAEELTQSCERITGKDFCIDFFIMNCKIGGYGYGDCRGFDRNAHHSQSRVQFYINPDNKAWELKYGCTKVLMPIGTPTSLPRAVETCDSAAVFDPNRDIQIFNLRGDEYPAGSIGITVHFKNNLCKYADIVCENSLWELAISATVYLIKDSSKPSGWRTEWIREGFPSMGVYQHHNGYYNALAEDAQKTKFGVNAIRALAGEIRSVSNNPPPPPVPPEGCWIE